MKKFLLILFLFLTLDFSVVHIKPEPQNEELLNLLSLVSEYKRV